MDWLEALILGIIQGVTEFLPISSDGHIELGKVLLNIQNANNLSFTVTVHVATVLSIIVVMRRDIGMLGAEVLKFQWNPSTKYFMLLVVSAIPVGMVGIFIKDTVEGLFDADMVLTGSMLLATGGLLLSTDFAKDTQDKPITIGSALLIGLAQALAVLPGLSRSGMTISVGLLIGINKQEAARFSFLMVIMPIFGAGMLETKDLMENPADFHAIGTTPLVIGFLTSFIVGIAACTAMLRIVKRHSLLGFSLYCGIVGAAALAYGLFMQ